MKNEEESTSSHRSNLTYLEHPDESRQKREVNYSRGQVPVQGDIVEVKLNDWPEIILRVSRVRILNQPIGIGDQRSRA